MSVVDSRLAQSATPDLNDPQDIPIPVFASDICPGPSTVKPYFTFRTVQSGRIVEPRTVGVVKKVILVVSVPHLLELQVDAAASRGRTSLHIVRCHILDLGSDSRLCPWALRRSLGISRAWLIARQRAVFTRKCAGPSPWHLLLDVCEKCFLRAW